MNTNGLRTLKKLSWAMAASSLLAFNAFADVGGVPQASINLDGSSMSYCNTVKNTWTVTKVASDDSVISGSSVTWTVTATKNNGGPAPSPTFCVEGSLVITNTGAAPATVGNIVVNLQRQRLLSGKQRWVSASVDIADKTNRDLATSAKVVAQASAENPDWNAAAGSNNYTVSNGVGTFVENAASGTLEFSNGDWNDVLATTAYTIGPGATVTLNYVANFDAGVLGINAPNGPKDLRTEVLVTFGNAGGRGGSGASITNVDINGNNAVDADENNVRTVPVRASMVVPPLEQCNPSVSLVDGFTVDGVNYEITGGTMPSTLTANPSTTSVYTIITTLTGEGTITNEVTMTGTETACCDAAEGSASATVTVVPEPPCTTCVQCPCGESEVVPGRCNPCTNGGYCTLTQGAYNDTAQGIGNTVIANFGNVFPSGLKIGSSDEPDGHAPWTAKWTNTTVGIHALRQYMGGNTGGSSLGADSTNASTTADKGLGSQTAALTMNVGFNDAHFMPNPSAPSLANLMVCPVAGSVSGPCPVAPVPVSTILGWANTYLAGGSVSGYPQTVVKSLVSNLNQGFDECVANGWAKSHTAQ